MKIGELAKRLDTPVETIRYWEREGLLPAPARSEGNYRLYNAAQLERLLFIRNCRSLDMSLDEIRQLLQLRDQPEGSCHEVNDLVDQHIEHVVKRIQTLQMLESQLRALRERCGNPSEPAHCGILQRLSAATLAIEEDDDNHLTGLHGR